jgi:hypothetical protein
MIVTACIICGHDITGRWPAQVCSMLCRGIARRRKRARKPAAYFERKRARLQQRQAQTRAERRVWRADIAARKRQEQLLSRQRHEARLMIWAAARKLRDLSARLKRYRNVCYRITPRTRQRERQATRQYRLQARQRDRARDNREMAMIYSLRERGWLRGYDIIRPGENCEPTRRASRRPAYQTARSKYRRFIWAYADRYQAAIRKGNSCS